MNVRTFARPGALLIVAGLVAAPATAQQGQHDRARDGDHGHHHHHHGERSRPAAQEPFVIGRPIVIGRPLVIGRPIVMAPPGATAKAPEHVVPHQSHGRHGHDHSHKEYRRRR